jgi:hypothetical protein
MVSALLERSRINSLPRCAIERQDTLRKDTGIMNGTYKALLACIMFLAAGTGSQVCGQTPVTTTVGGTVTNVTAHSTTNGVATNTVITSNPIPMFTSTSNVESSLLNQTTTTANPHKTLAVGGVFLSRPAIRMEVYIQHPAGRPRRLSTERQRPYTGHSDIVLAKTASCFSGGCSTTS